MILEMPVYDLCGAFGLHEYRAGVCSRVERLNDDHD